MSQPNRVSPRISPRSLAGHERLPVRLSHVASAKRYVKLTLRSCCELTYRNEMEDIRRYVDEQIFTLPGLENKEELIVLLTGSRATGTNTDESDVDIDVLCPSKVYYSIQKEMLSAQKTNSVYNAFYKLPEHNWERYFGSKANRPHFSLLKFDDIRQRIEEYDDVHHWIWNNAKVIQDSHGRFRDLLSEYKSYPMGVLVNKIKYRWLLSLYWFIDGYPWHHKSDLELLPAGTAIFNGINELYRFFFLVEGKPYPYQEKLASFVRQTSLGAKYIDYLTNIVEMVIGADGNMEPWKRLDKAVEMLCCSDRSIVLEKMEKECSEAMIKIGVDPSWVAADYDNIDELLMGKLGVAPF
jgi:hypothetical protein